MTRRDRRAGLVWALLLLAAAAAWVIPLWYMINVALRNSVQAFDPTLWDWPLTLENFYTVVSQNPLYLYFRNSLIVTAASVLLVAGGASMAAFALTRRELRGRGTIYSILLSPLMVPVTVLVIPLAQVDGAFNLLNTYPGLILPYVALGLPFGIVVLKSFMDAFPQELEDAALIDGCDSWRLYWHIVLPYLRPGLIVVMIWQFLTSWNEFFLALIVMTDKNMKTLPLVPMQYQGFYFSQPGDLFAILVIIAIPTIVFYALVQRYFVQGLLSGAIKT